MKLIEKQLIFAPNLARLILFTIDNIPDKLQSLGYDKPKIEIRLGEGYVGDSIDKDFEDTPHLRYGTHFLRIGQDLLLHVNNVYIETVIIGTIVEIIYLMMMDYWESLHPLNKSGGRWKKRDYHHWSMKHNGVS